MGNHFMQQSQYEYFRAGTIPWRVGDEYRDPYIGTPWEAFNPKGNFEIAQLQRITDDTKALVVRRKINAGQE